MLNHNTITKNVGARNCVCVQSIKQCKVKRISRLIIYMFDSLGLKQDLDKICTTYVMCDEDLSYEGIKWSTLSRDTIKSTLEKKRCLLDHTNTQNIDYDDTYWTINASEESICENYPGRKQTAKAQCESFLHDDANVVTLHDICKNLQCKTPHNNTVYFAGRALNGALLFYNIL